MLKYTACNLLLLETVLAAKLIFTPSIIKLKFDGTPSQVQVSLDKPDNSTFNVQFETSDIFRLDSCTLQFGPGKPSSQVITVSPAGLLAANITSSLKAKICNGFVTEEQSFPVRREVMLPTAMCQSFGDPSYRTFDKTPVTFQGVKNGWYCLAEHPSFTVQTQMREWSGGKNTNGNIAIRHWDGLLLFDISMGGQNVADKPYSVRKFGNQKVFSSITCEKTFAEIVLCEGGVIRIDYRFNKIWYADVSVQVPDFFCEKTKGICGNFDGKKDSINGTAFLMPANMVYYSNQKTQDLVAPSKPMMQCKITKTPSESMVDLKLVHCPTEQCIARPIVYQGCQDYCKSVFKRFTCDNKMIDVNSYIQDCTNDCNKSSDRSARLSFAQSAVAAFQQAAAFMANVCWRINDIKGTIALQKCARVEVKGLPTNCNITNSVIVGTSFQFPAMPKSCQNADGSFGCPSSNAMLL